MSHIFYFGPNSAGLLIGGTCF